MCVCVCVCVCARARAVRGDDQPERDEVVRHHLWEVAPPRLDHLPRDTQAGELRPGPAREYKRTLGEGGGGAVPGRAAGTGGPIGGWVEGRRAY